MKRFLFTAAAVALAGSTFLVGSTSATAVVDNTNPCNIQGWFTNPDEADREPERTMAGFVFENTDLIHHNAPAGLTTKELSSGDFTASLTPDQPSFFSVEVSGDDGGYATLRYNRLTHLWNMVTGGQFYEHADPDKLVDMPPVKRSHKVVRFGVGYTKSPPGTVKTVVSSVVFMGKVYTLKCAPAATTSPSATATATSSATSSPSTSATASSSSTPSSSASPTGSGSPTSTPSVTTSPSSSSSPVPIPSDAGSDGELPVTGASLGKIALGAIGALVIGVGAVAATRRRRRV